MDKIKFSKNFTLSKDNLKETLLAFRVNKFVTNVTWEVFHVATPLSSMWPFARSLAPSLALVPTSGGSRSAAYKTPATSKMVLKDPIIVSESRENSSEKDIESLIQSTSSPPTVGNIVNGDRTAK